MKFRFYTFINHLYMNEKQWGIQTAHAVSTMMHNTFANKKKEPGLFHDVQSWAKEEPTIIICEGGNVEMLTDLYTRLQPLAESLGLPCVKFHEDEASLGGVITCVGVLVPEYLFNSIVSFKPLQRGDLVVCPWFTVNAATVEPDTTEHLFLSIVKTARLA